MEDHGKVEEVVDRPIWVGRRECAYAGPPAVTWNEQPDDVVLAEVRKR